MVVSEGVFGVCSQQWSTSGSPPPGTRTRRRAATGSRVWRGRASTAASGGSTAGRPPGGPGPQTSGATSSLDQTHEAGHRQHGHAALYGTQMLRGRRVRSKNVSFALFPIVGSLFPSRRRQAVKVSGRAGGSEALVVEKEGINEFRRAELMGGI